MVHPEFPYVSLLAALLVLVPLPWHWRAGNVATISMIAWLCVVNAIYGIDAIIWDNNADIVVPVWCDITTKIIVGANMALPASCMCVCIHLKQVASMTSVKSSFEDKRRRQFVEVCLCFVVPILWMAVHYVVQGHRFDIIEGYGCRPSIYTSIPAIFLIWVPPLIFSAVTMLFAVLALNDIVRRRATFAKHLESCSGLSTSHYIRLMLMAVIETLFAVTSTSVTLWTATLNLRPWTSWADVHWGFSRVDQYLTMFMPKVMTRYYYALWWIVPVSSYVFFLFFAFGRDAMREYDACASWVRRRLFRRRAREHKPLTSTISPFRTMTERRNIQSAASFQSCVTLASSTMTLPDDYPPSPPPIQKPTAQWLYVPHSARTDPDVPSTPRSAFSSFYDSYSYQPSSLSMATSPTTLMTPSMASVHLAV